MRIMALIAILAASPVSAQMQTNCSTIGNQTNCQTGSVPNVAQQMLDNMAANSRQQAAISAYQNEAAEDLRAQAYNQVGSLIAQGKCDEAKRLATFYGRKDIVKATAQACP